MDYEKKYNDALKEIRELISLLKKNDVITDNGIIESNLQRIFPELRESEDERIRKGLIEALKTLKTVGELKFILPEPTREECIAYLEKQKEQKPQGVYVDCTEHPEWYGMPAKEQKPVKHPKMVEMLREHLENTPKEQLDVEFEELKNWNDVGPTVEEFFHGKPIEWNEKDERMRACAISLLQISRDSGMAINPGFGKPVRAINKCIDWLKSLPLNLKKKNEDVAKLCSNEWSEEDEEMLVRLLDSISIGNDYKEMRNWLLPKLKSLRPQPKVELSEDVKKTLDEVSHILVGLNYKKIAKDYKQAVEKLLSLRPSWKPSEEQMRGLAHTINLDVYDAQRYKLDTLYNDLKKLM